MFISEPTTALTDYAMAVQSVLHAVTFWRALRPANRPVDVAVRLYGMGFVMAAVAAFAGGSSHGFRVPLGAWWGPVWTWTVWTIVAAFVLLIAGGIRSAVRPAVTDAVMRQSGRRWLLLGFGLTAIGLLLLIRKVSIHPSFNHNDLYHVVQMGGLYGVYRGGRRASGLDA